MFTPATNHHIFGFRRFFNPAILCYKPMTLRPGERLALRYRILVHGERWGAGRLRAEHEMFSHQTPKSK